jgi:hypothetical protein
MYGLECLFRFYSYGLEAKFKPELYKDFEQVTLREFKQYNGLYGLEKFWAFHHYCGLPADCDVEVNGELKELLEGPYKTLDCFRKEQRRREPGGGGGDGAGGGGKGGGGHHAHHHGHGHAGQHGHGHGHGNGNGAKASGGRPQAAARPHAQPAASGTPPTVAAS